MEDFSKNLEGKPKEPAKEKLPFLSRLGRLHGVRELTAAMAFFAAMSGKAVPAEHGTQSPKEAQNIGLALKQKEATKRETKPESGFYHRFTKEEDGELKFNPWAFIAPLQAELGYSVKRQEKTAFNVPYEYSRFF